MRRHLHTLLAALTLAGAFFGTAQAQTNPTYPPLLTVSGEGIVRARPDTAIISAGVVSDARTAREALAANTAATNKMLNALRAAGIAPRDLQTTGFSVEPRYSQQPADYNEAVPFVPEIVGYSVRNELSVRIRDLAKVGQLLDAVIAQGANSISGPAFTIADPTSLQDQARRAAMQDAIHRASLYAQAAGVHLGDIYRIEETSYQPPQPMPMAGMQRMAMADKEVPIESGELTFQMQVTVAWQIGG